MRKVNCLFDLTNLAARRPNHTNGQAAIVSAVGVNAQSVEACPSFLFQSMAADGWGDELLTSFRAKIDTCVAIFHQMEPEERIVASEAVGMQAMGYDCNELLPGAEKMRDEPAHRLVSNGTHSKWVQCCVQWVPTYPQTHIPTFSLMAGPHIGTSTRLVCS